MQNDEGVAVDLYIPRKWYVLVLPCGLKVRLAMD
jgi:hypothetical protein